jgi:hypothetical protein
MDAHLRAHAATKGGFLHRHDILDLGGTDASIKAAVATGVIRRIRVGTYVFADEHDRLTPVEKHAVLSRAVVDKFPPGTVALSHHSAAVAHGLDVYAANLEVVHLLRLDGGCGRIEAGVIHHDAGAAAEEILEVDGRLVVDPGRAVWEVACTTSRRSGLVVMDSALHHGLVTPDELRDRGQQFERWPRSRVARLVARVADGGAESPGETLMRFLCWEHGLPRPETQVVVLDEDGHFVARTDLAWLLWRHYGEFDGLIKYVRDLRPGESASDVVVREKTREDGIRRLRNGMSRAVWSEVQPDRAAHTAERLRHELEQSRRLYTRNRTYLA